jgi:hypothetical protein
MFKKQMGLKSMFGLMTIGSALIVIFVIVVGDAYIATKGNKVVVVDSINEGKFVLNYNQRIKDYYQAIVDSTNVTIQKTFDFAHPRFKIFNKNIDSATTYHFARVANEYGLDSSDYSIEMYTGQLLLESGAKQYRSNGNLVVSSANCIGFCQVMPSTCRGYLMKYVDSLDIVIMKELGAEDFSFVYSNKLTNSQKTVKCREWLTNVNNNLIMWGYITRNNLDRKGDMLKQLVSYNMGTHGMKRYLARGGELLQHRYIRGIRIKLAVASH